MVPIEQTIVGIPMAMTLGFVFGMGPCVVSCLPYLGPVFLATNGGIRHSWRILLPLSLGRLTGYGGFGLAAGLAGQLVGDQIGTSTVRTVLGCATVMVGLALLLRRQPAPTCGVARPAPMPLQRLDKPGTAHGLMPGGLFLMGLGMALNPCTPLGIVMFSAAASASGLAGLALGLGFGIGAIAVPSLVYGIGVAYFGSRLRAELGNYRARIERLSAGLLILVGLVNIFR